jgi:hypothetical protein
MPRKFSPQRLTPDPEVGDDKKSSTMKELAGPMAITGAATAYAVGVAKEREERAKKLKEQRESRAAARENQKQFGMKKGGLVKASDKKKVWEEPRPKSLGKPKALAPKKKAAAKAAAKKAGRPYPNLVDNMRAARKK